MMEKTEPKSDLRTSPFFGKTIMGRIILLILSVCIALFLSFSSVKDESDSRTKSDGAEVGFVDTAVRTETPLQRAETAGATKIVLNDGGCSVEGEGARVSAGGVFIEGAGTYVISGTLTDGQVYAEAEGPLEIVLDGAKISSSKGSALTVLGEQARIVLADGSENELTDAESYGSGEYSQGCVFAEKNLVISGGGSLRVNGNYADGIACGEELLIESGSLCVSAARYGLKGGSVLLSGGSVVFA